MAIKMKNLKEIISDEFSFLINEFGFKIVSKNEDNGEVSVVFMKGNLGIEISFSFEASFLFIMVHRAKNDQLLKNEYPISSVNQLYEYDFNDYISIIDANLCLKPSYEYPDNSKYFDETNGYKNYISDFAKRLKKYGGNILNGDFDGKEAVVEKINKRLS